MIRVAETGGAGVHRRGQTLDAPADPGIGLWHAIQAAAVERVQAGAGHPLGREPGPAHQPVGHLRGLVGDAAGVDDVGLDERRAQHGDADAGAGQFGGKRLRQRKHARLAHVVCGHSRRGAERRRGRDVDDAAVAGLAEYRREHMTTVDRAPQVDAEHPVPVVDLGFADGRTARADTGVVDHQGGRPAEPVLRHLGQLDDVLQLGDVASGRKRLTACGDDGVCRCASGGFVDIAADHPAASRASSVANASPMPLPAPVMTAAASRLRFLDEPKMPIASTCRRLMSLPSDAADESMRCCASRAQPPASVGAVPGRRAPGPARSAVRSRRPPRDVGGELSESATSISAPPAWISVGGIIRPPVTSSVRRGWRYRFPRSTTRRAAWRRGRESPDHAAMLHAQRKPEGEVDQRRHQHHGRRMLDVGLQQQVDGEVPARRVTGDDRLFRAPSPAGAVSQSHPARTSTAAVGNR